MIADSPTRFGPVSLIGLVLWFVPASLHAQGLANLHRITDGVSNSHVEYHQISIAKGKEVTLADLAGPGKITYFYITDDTQVHWYPGLVLKVFWDDELEPSINVPLADFFGAIGSRTIDYQSTPLQINHANYMCSFPMPFAKRARFVLANDGDRDYSQSIAYGIDYESDARYANETSRLHACWNRSNPVKEGLHTILDVQGRGHYVGNILHAHSLFPGWFGEGDTIFYRDGTKIIHSPGTEDEYGSCWDFVHTFSYLNCGCILLDKGDNRMYRWYVANPVRFQKGLKVEIENQHDNGHATTIDADDYTSVAFWYQEEPHKPFSLQPFADRTAPSRAGKKL